MMWFLWVLCLLVGDVYIAPANRVANKSKQQCVWASLETQARHLGLTRLYNLTDEHKGSATYGATLEVLTAHNIKFRAYPSTNEPEWEELEKASQAHEAVAIVLLGDTFCHMVTLTDLTRDTVAIIDPDDPELVERVYPRKAIEALWDGWYIILERD